VTGTVTWNGKPLPQGHITFEHEGGALAPDAGTIKDGMFEVMVKPGNKLVRINASRERPGAKFDPAMGAVPREAYIPARYNAETTLRATVTPEGPNTFTYTLVEKEPG
jgi:hypothetical protein